MKKDSRKQFEKNLPLQYEAVFDYESNDCNFSSRSHSYDFAKNNLFFGKKTVQLATIFLYFEVKRVTYFFHEPINFVKSTFSAQSQTLPAKFENIISSIFDTTSKANKSFGLEIDK